MSVALEHGMEDGQFEQDIDNLTEKKLLMLIGSESATDKTCHNSERMKESRLINTSLMNLKDCMRGRSMVLQSKNHVHIPYRTSKLTLVLRDCFELAVRRPIKTAIVACVSPLETACYHSTNTLR